jgi:hypothetical protein
MPQTSSKDLATIAALALSNALQIPAPATPFSHIGAAYLQALRQLSDISTSSLPPTAAPHSPSTCQAMSQFRNTIPPVPMSILGSPSPAPPSPEPTYPNNPRQLPHLAHYISPRVSPGQAPSPRVAPGVNPRNVSSPRVDPTLPQHLVIPLTPHPSVENAPYVHQGTAGGIFDTFEEEHMVTPNLPKYSTRSRAQQNSANNAQHNAPCLFCPITFTNTQVYHAAPHKSISYIPMANAVINQDTGASLEYRQLIQDETTFPVWNKSAAHECGRLAQGVVVGGGLKDPTQLSVYHAKPYQKARLSLMAVLWWKSI